MTAWTRTVPGSFRLAGDLDFTTAADLVVLPEALWADGGDLEIDLADVAHANSAGLALLLEWLTQAGRRGRHLRFANLPDSLARLASLSNLGGLIGVPPAVTAVRHPGHGDRPVTH